MKTRYKPIRLGIAEAAAEFQLDRRTLAKRLKHDKVLSGKDGKFSILDIHRALSGDLESEKLRLTREQADGQAIKNEVARKELLPADAVQAHLGAVLVALRSGVLASNLMKEEKADLITNLRRLGEAVAVTDDTDPESTETDLEDTDAAA